jgi:hypothetical protein
VVGILNSTCKISLVQGVKNGGPKENSPCTLHKQISDDIQIMLFFQPQYLTNLVLKAHAMKRQSGNTANYIKCNMVTEIREQRTVTEVFKTHCLKVCSTILN